MFAAVLCSGTVVVQSPVGSKAFLSTQTPSTRLNSWINTDPRNRTLIFRREADPQVSSSTLGIGSFERRVSAHRSPNAAERSFPGGQCLLQSPSSPPAALPNRPRTKKGSTSLSRGTLRAGCTTDPQLFLLHSSEMPGNSHQGRHRLYVGSQH